jgi:transaldolase/glucose-6-phosphate isomerase
MPENPLLKLAGFGQSIWLDYIRRNLLASGELKQLIEEDGLKGVTSNPAIFEKAIGGSHDYDEAIRALALAGKPIEEIYQALTVADVQGAADIFRPLYDRLDGRDGFVSLELNPHLAHDTPGSINEGRRLWKVLNRPNVLIKVPATQEGLPVIKQLISEGINVNVTLLFGLSRYQEVAAAYLAGLEERAARGLPLNRVASVASFFLSRIDVLVDPVLEKIMAAGGPRAEAAAALRGETAIASAKVAHCKYYENILESKRWRALAEQGARPQRLLWASTSTKNPAYSDVKYVEPLIGPDTINTLPLETLNAYRDHGSPAPRLICPIELERAEAVLQSLAELGIDLSQLVQQLEDEGVEKFIQPYDELLRTLEGKRREALQAATLDRQTLALGRYEAEVQQRIDRLDREKFCARLWRKDASLWRADPQEREGISEALGWLHVAEKMEKSVADLEAFAGEVREAGFRHVVHMGMGGSSLAPLAFQQTFPRGEQGLQLTVLDTTDPATIRQIEGQAPLTATLFIVASKSGTTAEPLAFMEYFFARVKDLQGGKAGQNFVAVTDPGTPLAKLARERTFRRIFLNFRDIGGRYSALSYFGLLPAALMGLDVHQLLSRALMMLHACASCVPVRENPGVVLGAALGQLALKGRDKVTLVTPAAVAFLGMWLEQLLAESTGKEGTGLVPVTGEPLGAPSVYGDDRVFVHFRLGEEAPDPVEPRLAALKQAGHPVITIQMADRYDLAQEFFRWEVATAIAGAVLGINAFNQPNVQESKVNTNRLLQGFADQGRLPEESPTLTEGPLSLYLREDAPTAAAALGRFLGQARPGDYVALLAYLTEEPAVEQALGDLRQALRDNLRRATTVGYGPRYLHSTGQLHKGGPNTGVFFELTAEDAEELPIPGKPYSFKILNRAQALGDLESLRQHGRRVMRVHLRGEVPRALAKLKMAVESAMSGGKT